MDSIEAETMATPRRKRKPPEERAPRGRKILTAPSKPKKVLKIIKLREEKGLTWEAIRQLLMEDEGKKMTRQGPYLLYKHWRQWAEEEEKV
jgi:hypothetical protein